MLMLMIVGIDFDVIGITDIIAADYQVMADPSSSPKPSNIYCKNES